MENKKRGGVWSSHRCGDGGNPLRAAWTMRPGLAIVSTSLSLGAAFVGVLGGSLWVWRKSSL